jgi:AcrR family transcriptional regulator
MAPRLGQQHWIDEGLRSLRRGGVDAVRIEPLAKALGVTKGSFYWHFADRTAWLAAMLEAWQARATQGVIEEVEARGGDAHARLATLFSIVSAADGRLENAIRGWAAHDEAARAALETVDHRRTDYLDALFLDLGFSALEANTRSRFAYHALIGYFVMADATDRRDARARWLDIILPMLTRR